MRIRLLGLVFFGFSISLLGQNRTLVFNNEGQIVKNYAYERSQKNQMEMRFLIEKPHQSGEYFLLWQWRNEFNFQANIVYQSGLKIEKFKSGEINNIAFSKSDSNQRFFSFLLVKTNTNGASFLNNYIENKKKLSIDELVENSKVEYMSFFTNDEKLKLISAIDSKSEFELSLKDKKEVLTNLSKAITLDIQKLKSQVETKKLTLEKLSLVDEASDTPKLIKELSIELDSLTVLLVEKQSEKEVSLEKLNNEIKEIEKSLAKIDKGLKGKFTEINNKNGSKFDFLNQGIVVSKNHKTHEIVYDANYNNPFKSNIENLKIARLTPNLPQLTTDSELYCHIINLKREKLERNPFIISMTSEQSEPVEIESPSNLKNLENIVTSFDDGVFKTSELAQDAEGGLELNLKENAFLKHINSYFEINIDDRKKSDFYEPFSSKLIAFVQLEGFTESVENAIRTKIENLQKDFDDTKMVSLLLDLKISLKKISLTEFSPKIVLKPVFTEFMVKYPRPFEANRKPTIKLLSSQFKTENYLQKVTEGELKKESYDIKFDNIELVSDELPPVHRLFRFNINAGALITNSVAYNYEQTPVANSNINDLIEKKETSLDIRPSLTFSTYFLNQDVAVNTPLNEILKTTHFDISVDYADSKILDNIYLGLGIEPIRNLHLAGGIRIGEIDRVERDNYDPFKSIAEQDMNSEINLGAYFSVSLGFNLVPKFFNMIIKK